jgi:hypothetical protein
MKKLLILCLCGLLSVNVGYAQGKGHGKGHHKHHRGHPHGAPPGQVKYKERYVKVRPAPPRYTRVVSPGRNYVYIQDDWRWDPRANDWVWYGNRWVPAPTPGRVWVPGTWIQVSGGGWTWSAGTWR